MWPICCLISIATINAGLCLRLSLSGKTNDNVNEGRDFQFQDQVQECSHCKKGQDVEVQPILNEYTKFVDKLLGDNFG